MTLLFLLFQKLIFSFELFRTHQYHFVSFFFICALCISHKFLSLYDFFVYLIFLASYMTLKNLKIYIIIIIYAIILMEHRIWNYQNSSIDFTPKLQIFLQSIIVVEGERYFEIPAIFCIIFENYSCSFTLFTLFVYSWNWLSKNSWIITLYLHESRPINFHCFHFLSHLRYDSNFARYQFEVPSYSY